MRLAVDTPTEDLELFSIYLRSDTIANAYSRSTHSLLTYVGVTYSVFYLVFHVMKFTFDGIMEKLYVGALLESTY